MPPLGQRQLLILLSLLPALLLVIGCKQEPDNKNKTPTQESNNTNPTTEIVSRLVPTKKKAEVRVDAKETKVVVEFDFVIQGAKPVRISSIDSNCACLDARTPKTVYGGGEKGVLTAVFDLGERAGVQEKSVTITTTEPGYPTTDFIVSVHIPEVVKIEPNLLKWNLNGETDQKTINIDFVGEEDIQIISLSCTRPKQFKYELDEITKGRKYQIHVTPITTTKVAIGAIRFETNSKIKKYSRRTAFIQILKDKVEK